MTSQWWLEGKPAAQRDLMEKLALARQYAKAKADQERDERERDQHAKAVGRAVRKQIREQDRSTPNIIKCEPARVTGTRSGKTRLRRFETLAGLVHPKRSYVAKDGFSNFHCKFKPRGLGAEVRYRRREVVNAIRYILRQSAREIADGGVVSSISSDPDEIASVFAALEELELAAGRANAHVYTSIVITLPHELKGAREELLAQICAPLAEHDLPYAAVLHDPDPRGNSRNYHAHIVFSFRPFERSPGGMYGFSDSTRADLNTGEFIYGFRARAAEAMNAAMAEHGFSRRFTPESRIDRGMKPAAADQAKHTPGRKHQDRRRDNIQLGEAERAWLGELKAVYARLASAARAFAFMAPDYRRERLALAQTKEVGLANAAKQRRAVIAARHAQLFGKVEPHSISADVLSGISTLQQIPGLSRVPVLGAVMGKGGPERNAPAALPLSDDTRSRAKPAGIGDASTAGKSTMIALSTSTPALRDDISILPASGGNNLARSVRENPASASSANTRVADAEGAPTPLKAIAGAVGAADGTIGTAKGLEKAADDGANHAGEKARSRPTDLIRRRLLADHKGAVDANEVAARQPDQVVAMPADTATTEEPKAAAAQDVSHAKHTTAIRPATTSSGTFGVGSGEQKVGPPDIADAQADRDADQVDGAERRAHDKAGGRRAADLQVARAAAKARSQPVQSDAPVLDAQAILTELRGMAFLPVQPVSIGADGAARVPRFELAPNQAAQEDRDLITAAASLANTAELQAIFAAKWEHMLAVLRKGFLEAKKRRSETIFDDPLPNSPRLRAAILAAGQAPALTALQREVDDHWTSREQALEVARQRITVLPTLNAMEADDRGEFLVWSRRVVDHLTSGTIWLTKSTHGITRSWTDDGARSLLHDRIGDLQVEAFAVIAAALSPSERPQGTWHSSTIDDGGVGGGLQRERGSGWSR